MGHEIRGEFIGGGGAQECAPLLALVNMGARGSFFEVKLHEAHNSMPILQEIAFLGF
jgi:hypothetical protein